MRVKCTTDPKDECNVEIIDEEICITCYEEGRFCTIDLSTVDAKALGEELIRLAGTINED